jgi:hypothetical protein
MMLLTVSRVLVFTAVYTCAGAHTEYRGAVAYITESKSISILKTEQLFRVGFTILFKLKRFSDFRRMHDIGHLFICSMRKFIENKKKNIPKRTIFSSKSGYLLPLGDTV